MTVLPGVFSVDSSFSGLPAGSALPAAREEEFDDAAFPHPEDVRLYLRHVEGGEAIRALAREAGCHASTILRRIRRIEQRRDDPLVDRALEQATGGEACAQEAESRRETEQFRRILRRLSEPGAVMVVAEGMAKAIVVRDDIRTAILDRLLAERMAMNGWITLKARGRMSHYAIAAAGRDVLKAAAKARQPGALPRRDEFDQATPILGPFGVPDGVDEAETALPERGAAHHLWGETEITDPEDGARRSMRINLAESPIRMLGRRRGVDGTPFLSAGMVAAAERLRDDFEMAQLGPRVTQSWDGFMTAGTDRGFGPRQQGGGSENARNRVAAALRELGPGMGDLCLRVCCFLDGIETTERRLGWSARSGKIVLRLALMRLEEHYRRLYGSGSPMIG